jgi:PAS domain S-box-containing protein
MQVETKLKESEKLFRDIFDYSTVGKSLTAFDGKLMKINQAFADMLGYTIEEIQEIDFLHLTHPDDLAVSREGVRCLLAGEKATYRVEKRYIHKNGDIIWTDMSTMLNRNISGKPLYFITSIINITDRKHAEAAKRESDERYAMVLGAVNEGFWDWDVPSGNAYFSPIYYSMLGYDDEEFPGSFASWRLLVHPEEIDRVEGTLGQSIKTSRGFNIDLRMKMKSGEWLWVSTRGKTVERDGEEKAKRIVGTLTDISARKSDEEKMQALSFERELLLKEVHHRIKNNMSMIGSLLALQATRLSEPGAVKALNESRNRVMSMTAMYDLLFRTSDFRYVSVSEYIGKVAEGITASLPAITGVTLEKRIEDFVMDSKILFPIGIIINELVTNAYKYAFPDGRKGTITVSVSRLPENHVEIIVRDDGAGIPESVDINGLSGFGMKLVFLLVKQIEGVLECVRGGGTMFRINFQYDGSPPGHAVV